LTLWIHPEGRVSASLFLNVQNKHGAEEEALLDILNEMTAFLVLKRGDSDGVRLYNKAFIIRAEYQEETPPQAMAITSLLCRLHLSDSSIIEGSVREVLRPESSRLFDYLNLEDGPFAKIYLGDDKVCLVNKAYVVSVTPLSEHHSGNPDWCSPMCETCKEPA
jgi:hypothetical protein